MSEDKKYELEILVGREKPTPLWCVILNNYRIYGDKPGLGWKAAKVCQVSLGNIIEAIPELKNIRAEAVAESRREAERLREENATLKSLRDELFERNEKLRKDLDQFRKTLMAALDGMKSIGA